MTADEIRADIHKLDEKVPPAALAVFQVATLGEIGAQLAQLNVTLERLARAVEQSLSTPVPDTLYHYAARHICGACNRLGHDTQDCPVKLADDTENH